MIYGYARVSTNDQETTLQIDALNRAGCQTIYQEKTSSVGTRPELKRLLKLVGREDQIVVYKLDRLARSLKDLLQIIEQIETSKCAFRSLTEAIDTTTPVGKLMLNILGSFAEFERGLIRERAIAGQAAAYSRGVRWGGQPKVIKDEDAECLYDCYKTGAFSIPLLADIYACSESSIWRVIWRKDKPHAPSVRRGAPAVTAYLGIKMSR
jgi:DNA invertase Pin-like site-specific DNA recombinase